MRNPDPRLEFPRDSVYTVGTQNTESTDAADTASSAPSYDPRATMEIRSDAGLPFASASASTNHTGEIEKHKTKRQAFTMKFDNDGLNGIELEKKKKRLQKQISVLKVLVAFFSVGLVGFTALFALEI